MIEIGKISRWLTDVFHVEIVWIDKGQGRWMKRRRYPFILKAAALLFCACVAAALFLAPSDVGLPAREASLRAISSDAAPTISSDAALSFAQASPEPFLSHSTTPASTVLESTAPAPTTLESTTPASATLESTTLEPATPDPGPIPKGLAVKDSEYWVRIVKRNFALYLYRGGRTEKRYKVGVGKSPGDKQKAGDYRTPNGIFTVQSIENSSAWSHDFRDGKGVVEGAYGPWFIRLRTKWRGIGIHGTHDPNSRGTMVSEGCVRMLNGELQELKKFAFRGMKVVIEE
ncbi:MAG: L,D-transpeptidase family protein [Synergistaceae bacterium]|jgi:lipoprotein-anchoring transpeptidase ErfK/SrfK|nr:L,D-transpeptidase family protein [Synergistaceae bacterium]